VRRLAVLLATWFGCGYFPVGPGTIGSLAGIAVAVLIHLYTGAGRVSLLLLTLVLVLPAVWASTETAREYALKDPGLVVIDEVLGQWVTLLGATALRPGSFVMGFLLFRAFDIWKPWPVRNLESLPEGIGIVADDLAAGVYGALILYIGGALRIY
jgi:phosphatidylglycerophosphatase A